MKRFMMIMFLISGMQLSILSFANAREPDAIIDIWPGRAPGETTRETGRPLPRRPSENPPATRVKNITRPQLHVFQPPAEKRNGTAVLIFPGGGYSYVVTDKEGSEAAEWLNQLGITALVVHYRTKQQKTPTPQTNQKLPPFSERPLQDGQRALSLVRKRAKEWGIKPDQIGVIGFSAGGQAASLVTTRFKDRSYKPQDKVDDVSCRPDFSLLIYPWRLLDEKTGKLNEVITVSKKTPPTFLAHAHNDSATPLSSIQFYTALKQNGVGAELHIYETGGHGYGMRPVENSNVDTFPSRAEDWLRQRALIPSRKH
ncbi:alpha/beta hydrolase [Gimesia aquarii]|uniref:Acetylxylan esterase n=1 Tax=Gimesia aquarii TaxID=2527964 RepID=A0A517WXJ6_9PLAN|nr:alpha/beta hydrolase [Gimesia aquarii]QDU09978.1 Acetylxylan esterase precursor [Gimesia aquarii]